MTGSRPNFLLEINNLPDKLNEELLCLSVEEIFKVCPLNSQYPPLIMTHFVSSRFMQNLNKRYRNTNATTDVLSFPLMSGYQKNGRTYTLLGEIYLDPEYILKNTPEKNCFVKETLLVFIHGCLHLLGYSHDTPEQQKKILNLQANILENILL